MPEVLFPSDAGASRRVSKQQFPDSGVSANVLAASLHAASDQLQRNGPPPNKQKLTGSSVAAGASAAGLGCLHAAASSQEANASSALHSMDSRGGSSRVAGLSGHPGKRQKTSDCEDEVGSFAAVRDSSAVWPYQGAAIDISGLAGPGEIGRVSPELRLSHEEGVRKAPSFHKDHAGKLKGAGIRVESPQNGSVYTASAQPVSSSVQSMGTQQSVLRASAGLASPSKLSSALRAGGPPPTENSPQRMPRRCIPCPINPQICPLCVGVRGRPRLRQAEAYACFQRCANIGTCI